MNQEKIGLFIKNLRIKNNLSQQKLADILGVTSQAVSKWENGKNIPDISLIKEISKKFDVDINEIIDGEFKEKENIIDKKLDIKVSIVSSIIILIMLIIIYIIIINNNNNDYSFKILSTNCSNFNITGSIAYNDIKSSIYITNVEYCGGDDDEIYQKIECSLYEKINDSSTKISNSEVINNSTLEDYLKNLEFKIEHYSKVCKHFKDNSLYLEIIATTKDSKNIIYKIPLKLIENCTD